VGFPEHEGIKMHKVLKIRTVALAAAAFVVGGSVMPVVAQTRAPSPFEWSRVHIGGGGHNHGIIVHPAVPDLVYARQDVSGLLRWDPVGQQWIQLFDWMPVGWKNVKGSSGVAVDPSPGNDKKRQDTVYATAGQYANPSQMTPEGNGVWRSFDRGQTWTKIWDGSKTRQPGFAFDNYSFAANTAHHYYGEPLAVDPNNPDVLYAATVNDGLWRTVNARAERPDWKKIEGAPVGWVNENYRPQGLRAVMIDPRGGLIDAGRPTQRARVIYLGAESSRKDDPKTAENEAATPVFEGGLFRSDDGGETFQLLKGENAPDLVARMTLGPDNSILVTTWGRAGIHKWDGKAWSILPGTQGKPWKGITTDPADRRKIVANHGDMDTALWRSTDGGQTWSKHGWEPYNQTGVRATMENTNWTYYGFNLIHSSPTVSLDPHRAGRLWYGGAFDLAYTDNVWADEVVFKPQLKGAETTVGFSVSAPPVGDWPLYYTCADVAGFRFTDVSKTPAQQLPVEVVVPTGDPKNGDMVLSDVEWAPSEPGTQAIARSTLGGYFSPLPRLYLTRDAGKSWISRKLPEPNVPNAPDWGRGFGPGKIAFSSTNPAHVVAIGTYRTPHFSRDVFKGDEITWTPGKGIDWFWNDANPYGGNNFRLEADPVDGNRFYLVVANVNDAPVAFVSADGGATWSVPGGQTKLSGSLGPVDSMKNPQTGKGELWVPLGGSGLWKTSDGGTTFERVAAPAVRSAQAVAFGKAAPNSQVPTVYLVGKVEVGGAEKEGVFLSIDGGQSWQPMTPEGAPLVGGLIANDMAGDWRQFGRVYIATSGTGAFYSTAKN
jgi:photosystem II stability/assembly factor-like uncharacterized protein